MCRYSYRGITSNLTALLYHLPVGERELPSPTLTMACVSSALAGANLNRFHSMQAPSVRVKKIAARTK